MDIIRVSDWGGRLHDRVRLNFLAEVVNMNEIQVRYEQLLQKRSLSPVEGPILTDKTPLNSSFIETCTGFIEFILWSLYKIPRQIAQSRPIKV